MLPPHTAAPSTREGERCHTCPVQSSMADGAPLPSGAHQELSRVQQPLTSRAFVSNRCPKAKATVSAELTSPASPNLVALSSSREGEASLSQGFLRVNNPWPCHGGWRAMPQGPAGCWFTQPQRRDQWEKGGLIFVVLLHVFVQKNKTCIRRRETTAQHSSTSCQDAAGPPGMHTMHAGAVGVAS